jgi:NAD-dependent SIR2 family protein deacetylase
MKMEIKGVTYEDCCSDCGNKRYEKKRDMGMIGVAIRRCPLCQKKTGIIPARDWAYQAGVYNKFG